MIIAYPMSKKNFKKEFQKSNYLSLVKYFLFHPITFFNIIKKKKFKIIADLDVNDTNKINIFKIAVKYEHRGNGIGKKLLKKIIDISKSKYKYVSLTVKKENLNVINLYKSMGFIIYKEYEKDIYMILELF